MSNSFFLEGLKTARTFIKCDGCAFRLDQLIEEHESGAIETAALRPQAETR